MLKRVQHDEIGRERCVRGGLSLATTTLLALATTATAVHADAAPEPKVMLDKPVIRLWYQNEGRLSDDIAPPRDITLWNTVIGEGGAGGIANDALFTVRVRVPGDEANLTQPVTLTAIDAHGKVLAKRTVAFYLTSSTGANLPLWVRDVACAGRVTFTARVGTIERKAVMNFDCGE